MKQGHKAPYRFGAAKVIRSRKHPDDAQECPNPMSNQGVGAVQ